MARYAKDEYLAGQAKAKGLGEREQVMAAVKPRTPKAPKGFVNMKRTKTQKKANEVAMKSSEDDYPYGLGLHLDEDSMDKLGAAIPAAGKSVHIHAKAKVTRSEVHNDDRGTRRSAHLQVTHMKMVPDTDKDEE